LIEMTRITTAGKVVPVAEHRAQKTVLIDDVISLPEGMGPEI
jgi:hypothetical protein